MHTECVCVCTCWFRQRIIIKLGECKHVVNLKALIDRGILWYSHHELSSIPMKCDFFKSLLLHWSYNFLELRLQPHLLHLLSSTTLGIKWYWYTPYPYQPTVATDGPRWWWRKLREIDASLPTCYCFFLPQRQVLNWPPSQPPGFQTSRGGKSSGCDPMYLMSSWRRHHHHHRLVRTYSTAGRQPFPGHWGFSGFFSMPNLIPFQFRPWYSNIRNMDPANGPDFVYFF